MSTPSISNALGRGKVLRMRKPPPPRRPLPLPLTLGTLPLVCSPCPFVSCCERTERLGDNAVRTCKIIPPAKRAAAWIAAMAWHGAVPDAPDDDDDDDGLEEVE